MAKNEKGALLLTGITHINAISGLPDIPDE